jgi:hypothetical protein
MNRVALVTFATIVGILRTRQNSEYRLLTTNRGCRPVDFWNFAHQARIRVFLERLVGKSAWFSRPAGKGGVTKEVIFGTGNRVSRRCSKNPKWTELGRTMRGTNTHSGMAKNSS